MRSKQLLESTRKVIRVRREHPTFRRKNFFQGQKLCGPDVKGLDWLKADGSELIKETGTVQAFGMRLSGKGMGEVDERGREITDSSFLFFLNPTPEPVSFSIPASERQWAVIIDTGGSESEERPSLEAGSNLELRAHSLALLKAEARE